MTDDESGSGLPDPNPLRRRIAAAAVAIGACAVLVLILTRNNDSPSSAPVAPSAPAVDTVPVPDTSPPSVSSAPASTTAFTTTSTTVPLRPSLSCADADLDEITELIRSGTVPLDTDRLPGLGVMAILGDRTVTGAITAVVREPGNSVDWTVLDVEVAETLAGAPTDEPVRRISFPSSVVTQIGDDPIAESVQIEGLRFVAVLERLADAPGGWAPFAQGLSIACDDDDTIVPVRERFPNMPLAKSWSLAELVDAARALDLTVPVPPEPITRPIFDPAVCATTSVRDAPEWDVPLALFAKPSEFPVPIQVFADPTLGPAGPIVMVLRFRDRPVDRVVGDDAFVTSFGEFTDVRARVFDNGAGEASWTAPDGTTGYMRSFGVDEVGALIKQIAFSVPRDLDAPIPAFDYSSNPQGEGTPSINGQVQLIHEAMDSDLGSASLASSECIVESTGNVYTVTRVTADPVMLYRAVLDRPAPLDVGLSGADVVIINGRADAAAPTIADVRDATDDTWDQFG